MPLDEHSSSLQHTRIHTTDPDVSPTYPPHLIMPICTPDMDIIRGASLYKEGRFPTLTWVHKNGAALLRSAATKDERCVIHPLSFFQMSS